MIYRRRYTCPECESKGRTSTKDRTNPKHKCPRCGTWLYLQVQNPDGVYEKPNEPVDRCEYYI